MSYKSMSSAIRTVLTEETKKPSKREVGTDSLVKSYKEDTPGQSIKINESTKAELAAIAAKAIEAGSRVKKIKAGEQLSIKQREWDKAAQNGGKVTVAPPDRKIVSVRRGDTVVRRFAENEVLDEKYIGFKKLEGKIESEGKGKEAAGAIAAAIGRKKYGKGYFDKHAEEGKKLKEDNIQEISIKLAKNYAYKASKDADNEADSKDSFEKLGQDWDAQDSQNRINKREKGISLAKKKVKGSNDIKVLATEETAIEVDTKINSKTTPPDLKLQRKNKIIDEKYHGLSKDLIEAVRLIGIKSNETQVRKIGEEIAYKKANGYIKD